MFPSSLPLAFLLGLFSSLSPCFFPLIPSFIAFVVNIEKNMMKGVLAGVACMLGIAVSLVTYGGLASFLFAPLSAYGTILRSLFGVIIIILGVALYTQRIGGFIRLPTRLLTVKGFVGAFILGLTYTLIAAPCALPIFASAFLVAIIPENPVSTLIHLLALALGMSLPFLISPIIILSTKKYLTQYQAFAKWFKVITSFIVILTGLLLILPLFGFPSIF